MKQEETIINIPLKQTPQLAKSKHIKGASIQFGVDAVNTACLRILALGCVTTVWLTPEEKAALRAAIDAKPVPERKDLFG